MSMLYLAIERWRAEREKSAYAGGNRAAALERIRLNRCVGAVNGTAVILIAGMLLLPLSGSGAAGEFVSERMTEQYVADRWAQLQQQFSGRLDISEKIAFLTDRTDELAENARFSGELAGWTDAALNMPEIRETGATGAQTGLSQWDSAVNSGWAAAQRNLSELRQSLDTFDSEKWLQTAVQMLKEQLDDWR